MGRTSRKKRSTLANRAIVASAALILGGGGLVAVNVYASAGEGSSGAPPERSWNAGRQMSTIDCPDAGIALPDVPDRARPEVDRELAAMDTQITDAYRQFADRKEQIARDPNLAENAVLGPLKNKRAASLDRIGIAIERNAVERPQNLDGLAPCSLRADDGDGSGQGGEQGGEQGGDPGGAQNPGRRPTRARTAARTRAPTRAAETTRGSRATAPTPRTSSTSSRSSPMSTAHAIAAAPLAVRSPPTAGVTRTANSILTMSSPHPV